jgi:hypothetical protein
MSERLIVSVDAPSRSPDLLRVQDVFQHVLELFDLVSESDPGNDGNIVWRLVSVNMNSPLTVTAEAIAARPDISNIDVEQIARKQKTEFSKNYASLRSGRVPAAWQSGHRRRVAKSIMARNHDGIGRTNIDFGFPLDEVAPVVLTQEDAEIAILALDADPLSILGKVKDQVGSVEGKLMEVLTHYGKPAIRLRERRTNADVICIIPDEFKHQIADRASIEDVWNGRRVIVRGVISYSENRTISRVVASHIRAVDAEDIPVERIQDKTFTAGMTAAEYLEKLREGSLG